MSEKGEATPNKFCPVHGWVTITYGGQPCPKCAGASTEPVFIKKNTASSAEPTTLTRGVSEYYGWLEDYAKWWLELR